MNVLGICLLVLRAPPAIPERYGLCVIGNEATKIDRQANVVKFYFIGKSGAIEQWTHKAAGGILVDALPTPTGVSVLELYENGALHKVRFSKNGKIAESLHISLELPTNFAPFFAKAVTLSDGTLIFVLAETAGSSNVRGLTYFYADKLRDQKLKPFESRSAPIGAPLATIPGVGVLGVHEFSNSHDYSKPMRQRVVLPNSQRDWIPVSCSDKGNRCWIAQEGVLTWQYRSFKDGKLAEVGTLKFDNVLKKYREQLPLCYLGSKQFAYLDSRGSIVVTRTMEINRLAPGTEIEIVP